MDPLAPRPVPLLTPSLPGTGGVARQSEEDFAVEELPLYEASGAGDHLLLTVWKQGRTTPEVAGELAAALGVSAREVGTAGLKDKRAVTVQRMTVPMPVGSTGPRAQEAAAAALAKARAAAGQGFRVLSAERHDRKLRTGHLRGNRFRIVLRACGPDALARAQGVVERLGQIGAANLFGPQRFGRRQDNAALGAALLRREPAAQLAVRRDRFLRRLALSALQAELFNRCLAARVSDGTFDVPLAGDVLRKRASGGLFHCEDPALDGPRLLSGEIDVAGPLPGHSLFAARGEVLAREAAVVAEAGLDPRSFAVGGGEMEGTRRAYRIAPGELRVEPLEDDPAALVLHFSLPPGSYALSVLREVMKPDLPTQIPLEL